MEFMEIFLSPEQYSQYLKAKSGYPYEKVLALLGKNGWSIQDWKLEDVDSPAKMNDAQNMEDIKVSEILLKNPHRNDRYSEIILKIENGKVSFNQAEEILIKAWLDEWNVSTSEKSLLTK